MNTQYTVRAKRWAGGWELHIEDVGVTQARLLTKAKDQVRDYLETLYGVDVSDVTIDIVPELGDLTERAHRAKVRTRAAERAQLEAAAEARETARALRDAGLSTTDAAFVLGVSKGRVSQLIAK